MFYDTAASDESISENQVYSMISGFISSYAPFVPFENADENLGAAMGMVEYEYAGNTNNYRFTCIDFIDINVDDIADYNRDYIVYNDIGIVTNLDYLFK